MGLSCHVSTDFDTSNKLYFEPLMVEDVLSIYQKEEPDGLICQFGGQTPLNIAAELEEAGVTIIGTTPDTIGLAEDRDRFRQKMQKLGIPEPESGMASTLDEAMVVAERIGYPLMVRPSFVRTHIGDRALGTGEGKPPVVRTGVRRELSPNAAAETIARGIERGSRVVWVGREARLSWWAWQLLPRFYERQMIRRTLG